MKKGYCSTGFVCSCRLVPQRGGNSNNGVKDGAFYVNLNNDASNSNWNIGAA